MGALLVLSAAASATAQELRFSLSGDGTHDFGTLEDQELAVRRANGVVEPWMRTLSSAFFCGDQDGDGLSEVFNDVDALSTGASGAPLVSLLQDLAGWKDGDVLRLTTTGTLEVWIAESELLQAFGVTDGNCDVDAFHYGQDGVHLLSFAEDETSTVLDSDGAGAIADGAILSYEPATGAVAVVYSEADVDAMVSNALAGPTTTLDTLSVARTADGTILFSVQSPSAHDGSVFSDQAGGTIFLTELSFGFQNTVELDALDWREDTPSFPVVHAASTVIVPGQVFTLEMRHRPLTELRVLLAFDRGDAGSFLPPGFGGLFLDPADPLLWWSLGSSALKATTDGVGVATLDLPLVPVGTGPFQFVGQVWSPSERILGTPFALDVQ